MFGATLSHRQWGFKAVGYCDHISYFASFALFCAWPSVDLKNYDTHVSSEKHHELHRLQISDQLHNTSQTPHEKKSSVWMKLLLMLRKEWHHYFLAAPRTNVRVLVELMRTFTGKAATRLGRLNEVAVTFGVVWRIVLNCAFKRILNKSNVLVYLLFQIVNCRLCLEDIYVAWCYINHWIIPEPALLSFLKLLWKKPETIK